MQSQREQWLEARRSGIGASDAASVLGLSPYKTNVQLWEEKIGKTIPSDISDNPAVAYGKAAEEVLRELFKLHFPEYTVEYDEFGMVYNPEHSFIFATLDGSLTDANGRRGILEIKTAELRNGAAWSEWSDGIPQHYYIQVLHQFLATGYDFAVLCAELKTSKAGNNVNYTIKHYFFEREQCAEDIQTVKQAEIEFWEKVKSDTKPNLILPSI